MGMAPVAHVLFNKFMTFNPKNPHWVNRDRFVLSYVFFCFFFQFPVASALYIAGNVANLSAATVTDACFNMRSSTFSATMSALRT